MEKDMKNAFISVLLVIAFSTFFSLSSNSSVSLSDGSIQTNSNSLDTVPHKKPVKKDSVKKPATNPYDSFGKPKKMDTTALH